ncbi:hypothetical protein [Brevibacillus brevis]|uniref:hypothetical protein n=1 Tax=Brevibacillus brevis TaxID=1393 RepID=UPI000D0F9C28|nr:hypothetical protein [Brevibacillus brevis]PSJ66623.1 hypothetical protein C7J99_24870 [Brevibacillus brevis]RED20909.1 hypothetical protein DES34_1289 [Brevibacillus brevis]VEF86620.1 transcription factor, RsfA family [Brevibacillus brevis]
MGRVIISEFTPQEKLKLSKIVLNCVSKGEGETELDALKKAFEIAKVVLKKPTAQMCQYVWQEHLRNYYRALYEKALQKGSKNRSMRKVSEENRYLVSLVCTEILKGQAIGEALRSVSKIVNLKESTIKTKWYALMRIEEYKAQYDEALKNQSEFQAATPETPETFQNASHEKQSEDGERPLHTNEAGFLDSINSFITSFKTLQEENENLRNQNDMLQEKYERVVSELKKMKDLINSLEL